MKKSLVALAALAATGAFAQSSVTISGNLSFGALTNTARDVTATTTKTTTYGGIDTTNANRVNVIAVEDLGGGLKVTGRVDNRLTTLNATRGTGDMFVQVDGGFGSFKIGQYTYASNAAWNAGAANTVSTVSTTAQNLSTSIASYTTPAIAGLTASAALDLDTSGNSVGKDGWGLKFNYAAGPIGAQVSYTQAPKLASTATLSPIKVMSLAVSYDLGVAKVFFNQSDVRAGGLTIAQTAAGYYSTTTLGSIGAAVSANKQTSLSATIPVGAAVLKAGYINRKGDTNVTIIDRAMVGVDYALSKRTTLVAEMGQDKQAVTGANRATNSFVGINHSF